MTRRLAPLAFAVLLCLSIALTAMLSDAIHPECAGDHLTLTAVYR